MDLMDVDQLDMQVHVTVQKIRRHVQVMKESAYMWEPKPMPAWFSDRYDYQRKTRDSWAV
jgi:hypothetical protein